jgi:hypothetical protein
MTSTRSVDGVLVEWGERLCLFYPGNRTVKTAPLPRLGGSILQRALGIRQRIHATVTVRAPQVMVKVTGGGHGMAAIAAHFRYISKNGQLTVEDDGRVEHEGKEALRDLVDQWRYGGSFIDEVSHRREAFNIMLSMPRGTGPDAVMGAAREFAQAELAGHRWVMVLHDHQANPHVHLSVRAESTSGQRLNPRKADLHRWRETFAEKLRDRGIKAEATRQFTREANQRQEALWRIKARGDGRLRKVGNDVKAAKTYELSRREALTAWAHIVVALNHSEDRRDRELAKDILQFLGEPPYVREAIKRRQREWGVDVRLELKPVVRPVVTRDRPDPEMER